MIIIAIWNYIFFSSQINPMKRVSMATDVLKNYNYFFFTFKIKYEREIKTSYHNLIYFQMERNIKLLLLLLNVYNLFFISKIK